MTFSETLKQFKVPGKKPLYLLYARDREALEMSMWQEYHERRVRFLKKLKELGFIDLDVLSPRNQKVLEIRFIEGKSLEETAQEFGVTRERIRQIEQKALESLRESRTL